MSANPFLSIIIPVYNTEYYLSYCLDSVLAQDFTDYEIILIDDGSTDDSSILCDRYAASHERIRCIHQANCGHTASRQHGVRVSRGRYIAFVDSDDWVSPQMYGLMCSAAKETDADIVHCDFTAMMPLKQKVCNVPFPAGLYSKEQLEETVYPNMIYFGTYFVFGVAPNLWNKLFKRELLEKYLFRLPHRIIVGEDGLITYGCMLEASSVYFYDKALYFYRSNPRSLCHQMDTKRLAENHTMFETYEQFIHPDSRPAIKKQLQYFFVYQSLLTFVPVFRMIRKKRGAFRQTFLAECDNPYIRDAFETVPLQEIKGLRNRLCAFCIRHRLPFLFRLFIL